MDEFDFIERKPKRRFRFGAALLNLLSLGILMTTLAVGAYYLFLFFDPYSEYNPFPPPAQQAASTLPAASPTPLEPTSEELAEATVAEPATSTPKPSATATPIPATATITPTRAPGSYYEIQPGSPVALDYSVFNPDVGCSFLGVAGQAFGLEDTPIPGLRVQVTGALDGESVDKLGLTGAASHYGAGSYYEIVLADDPIASDKTLDIQIVDEDGLPASDAFSFKTFSNCEKNLIFINFKALP